MNVPNMLSLFRLLLVPVFPLVYFSGWPHANLWAAGVYALASATDVLDGIIARRYNLVTKLGRILDPLADKVMSIVVIICISYKFPLLWWAAGVYLLKEAAMGIGALLQYKKIADVPPSQPFGKFSAACFFVVCVLILFFENLLPDFVKIILVSVAVLSSLFSLIGYAREFFKLMKKK